MESLIVERDRGVVTVTMNRPERKNAMNGAMIRELGEVFLDVESRVEDRAMVLTGAGGAFCSGADLSDSSGPATDPNVPPVVRMRRLGDLALALHRVSKPTIARVEGYAVGAGFSLVLGCDLAVASETAKFSMIFPKRGLSLDNGATWWLPRLIGMARAKELAYFGEMYSAADVLELGLVNRVVPPDSLDGLVDEWARKLGSGPTLALSMSKRMLHESLGSSLDQMVETEARCQAVNFASEDTAEAMKAFREKRDPDFVGK